MDTLTRDNTLIAQWMGYDVIDKPPVLDDGTIVWSKAVDLSFPDNTKDQSHLSYHWDWNELMPVYKKIREIINDRSKYDKHTILKGDLLVLDIDMAMCEVNINKSFDAIVEFIKWENKINNKS